MDNQLLEKNNTVISIGFFILTALVFLRPIVSAIETRTGFPFQIAIPLLLSYLLFLHLLIVLKFVKIDKLSILIVIYCFYCIFSIAWGSDIKDTFRIILPFICLFSTRTTVTDSSRLRILIAALIVGYSFTIIPSAFLIFKGESIQKIDYYSGVARQFGVYVGAHSLAHAMLFFSFIYIFFLKSRYASKTVLNTFLHLLFAASVYCMWNSYVRSAYVGFFVFWALYFMFNKKRYFLIFILLFILLFIWKLPNIETIFFKTKEFSFNAASSGRIVLWTHNLQLFIDSPFYTKLLGSGIGSELQTVRGLDYQVWSSHNDYLSLLMTVGILGLVLYLSIIVVLLKDIIYSDVNKNTKAIFLSSVLSLLTTSMLTNSYIVRFEMSQLFWIFMGCFYCHQSIHLNIANKG